MKIPMHYRVLGYYRIRTEEKYRTRLQNILLVLRIPSYADKNGSFFISRFDKQRVQAAAKRERLPLSVSGMLGVPRFLKTQRYRIGIPIGVLLGTLLVAIGSNTVWRVDISGNEMISEEKIEEELAEIGFGVGSRCTGTDYDSLIATYRLLHPEIAWMGIYTQGTTAYVRVIENERRKEEKNIVLPSHLIATEDAIIERMEIAHGTSVVRQGSVVKKGDILALGIANGAYYDRILPAEGVVIGKVSKQLSVIIPRVEEEKKEIFREIESLSLNFFQKTINIFKKNNKNALDYVIIKRKEVLRLGERLPLPWGYTVKETVYYTVEQTKREEDVLIRDGMSAMDAMIRNEVGEGELLSKKIHTEEKDGAIVIYATVEYTKNIADRLSFAVGNGEDGG